MSWRILCVAVALSAALPTCYALINPKYTVTDLVRDSSAVLVLRVSSPKDGRMTATAVEALVGAAPAEKPLTFDLADAEDLDEDRVAAAFDGAGSAMAVMCISKQKEGGQRVGAMEIGTLWIGLTDGGNDTWIADRDPRDLETVWGGSARQLVPAIRYVLRESGADFPVEAALTWRADGLLGKLAGPARGCVTVDFGGDIGTCLVVLSDAGDRAWQIGRKDAETAEVTAQLGLTSKSRKLAAGDFNGDGRLDLASWDGQRLGLHLRCEDGRLAAVADAVKIADCRTLATLDGGLLVADAAGFTLYRRQLQGGLAVLARVASPADADLGPGGLCAVADFTADGAPDVVQVHARGFVMHEGTARAGQFGAPRVTKLNVLHEPKDLVCGDYDADGQLDVIVAGTGGLALLMRDADGKWLNAIAETGELGAAGVMEQVGTDLVAAASSDLNGDGRQAAVFFSDKASPGLYFNRGFACFGIARTLSLADSNLPAAQSIGQGQQAGAIVDLNGDLVPDLLAVDREGRVRYLLGAAPAARRFHLTAVLDGSLGSPLTVSVSLGKRQLGIHVLRPGEPASIALPMAGRAALRWKMPDGGDTQREATVVAPGKISLGK